MTFKLLEQHELKDIQSEGYLYEHEETGAQVLYLKNDDQNKAFTIAFKTPPYSDNGITHILEHSVLNGSAKYPSKEPFVELLKGSLNTFVNAMTFSDKTIYPVASTNQQDFNNLVSVYLDAVFAPRFYEDEMILQQEGWHYHLENTHDPLIYKGVVYNEMKGAMGSSDVQLSDHIVKALYPNTCYSFEYGGLPSAIPSLTQEEFIEYHQNHYHPSQSLTILYGDLNLDDALEMLAEYFDGAGQAKEQINLAIDVPYVEDVTLIKEYSIAEGEDPSGKDYIGIAWHAHVADDLVESVALDVLVDVLFGNQQSPIKRALLDAEIAGDFDGSHNHIGYFSSVEITANLTNVEKMDRFRKVLDESLQKVADEGVEADLIESTLNRFAFRQKENLISESNPRGVIYGITALQTWLYGLDPFKPFDMTSILATLRERFAQGYLQELVKIYFLENPHRVQIGLKAVPGLNDQEEKALYEQLQTYKASLSAQELDQMVVKTQALMEKQNRPDSPEDLAKIPTLQKEDLTTETEDIPFEVSDLNGADRVYFAPQFTAGIDYLSLLLNIDDMTLEETQWLTLLSSLLGKLQTKNYSSQGLITAIGLSTGGIGAGIRINEQMQGRVSAYFVLNGKALEDNNRQLSELMTEILLNTEFMQEEVIRDTIQSLMVKFEDQVDFSAHALAAQRANSQLSGAGHLQEVISGIDFYFFLKERVAELEQGKGAQVFLHLRSLYEQLNQKARLSVYFVGQEENKNISLQHLEKLLAQMTDDKPGIAIEKTPKPQVREAIVTSQDVNYVALRGYMTPSVIGGQHLVLANAIRYDYLWNKIRVKGGAYGAMLMMRQFGDIAFASYRDPNIRETLEVYRNLGSYIDQVQISSQDLLKYMIGTLSELNQPMSAYDKGNAAFTRYLLGMSREDIVRFKEEILATDVEQIKGLKDQIQSGLDQASFVVIGNKAQIEKEKDLFDHIIELA